MSYRLMEPRDYHLAVVSRSGPGTGVGIVVVARCKNHYNDFPGMVSGKLPMTAIVVVYARRKIPPRRDHC